MFHCLHCVHVGLNILNHCHDILNLFVEGRLHHPGFRLLRRPLIENAVISLVFLEFNDFFEVAVIVVDGFQDLPELRFRADQVLLDSQVFLFQLVFDLGEVAQKSGNVRLPHCLLVQSIRLFGLVQRSNPSLGSRIQLNDCATLARQLDRTLLTIKNFRGSRKTQKLMGGRAVAVVRTDPTAFGRLWAWI